LSSQSGPFCFRDSLPADFNSESCQCDRVWVFLLCRHDRNTSIPERFLTIPSRTSAVAAMLRVPDCPIESVCTDLTAGAAVDRPGGFAISSARESTKLGHEVFRPTRRL